MIRARACGTRCERKYVPTIVSRLGLLKWLTDHLGLRWESLRSGQACTAFSLHHIAVCSVRDLLCLVQIALGVVLLLLIKWRLLVWLFVPKGFLRAPHRTLACSWGDSAWATSSLTTLRVHIDHLTKLVGLVTHLLRHDNIWRAALTQLGGIYGASTA